MPEESNDLIHTPEVERRLPTPSDALRELMIGAGQAPIASWCSFMPSTPTEKAMYFAALDGDTLGFDELLNQEIEIENVAFQSSEGQDKETGEVYRSIRTVLFLADGRVASGRSVYVARSVWNMMQAGFVPPYKDPMRVKIVQITLDGGRRMYKLQQLGLPTSAAVNKKGQK